MSSDLVFGHRYFSVLIFDILPLWRQAISFAGLDSVHLPEVLCQWPGFDYTVAARQGLSLSWICVVFMALLIDSGAFNKSVVLLLIPTVIPVILLGQSASFFSGFTVVNCRSSAA